jgi:cytochrome c biogenesis protein CcdA/glutaredoxin
MGLTRQIFVTIALWVLVCGYSAFAASARPVSVLVFRSEDCEECGAIEPERLEALALTLGCEIRPRYLSVEEPDNYRLLVRLEERFGDEGNELPVVFIGGRVLGGAREIEAELEALVGEYARSGGAGGFPDVVLPAASGHEDAPRGAGPRVYLAYFTSPGCADCRRAEHVLKELGREFPSFVMKTFPASDRENRLLQEAMTASLGLSSDRRLITPTVVVGERVFVADEITDRALRGCVSAAAEAGTPCPWERAYDLEAAEARLRAGFGMMSVAAVVTGGLLDGVNPCAFATLILFVSYMRVAGRERGKLLAVGLSFIAAVFVAYLLVGLGLLEVVALAENVPHLDAMITWGIVALCVALAALSLADAVKAARHRHREIYLQLPQKAKRGITAVLRRFGRTRYLVLGGLAIGGLVSMLELVCTGQIYLPLIKVMASAAGAERSRALALLVVYNACFVLPLIAVFASAYWGMTSERLGALLRKHMAATKVATSLFFVMVAALMVVTRYGG